MNPHDWMYPVHRLQTHPEPMRGVENTLMMSRDWQTHSTFAAVQPHSSKPVWRATSQNCQDLDGEPQDGFQEDSELARKRKELQEIHEMILYKKSTIAAKALQHENNPAVPSVSHDQQLDLSPRETLKNRVTQILLQRPFSLFSKVQKERSNSSNQSKGHLQQQHHPLKLRVKALRMHRPDAPFVPSPKRDEIPDVLQLPLHQRIHSPPEDKKRGFERFVKMLNKGADTSLLEMVSDVSRPRLSRDVTSPTKEENDPNEGHKNFLCVVTRTPGSNTNKTVSDVPRPPPRQNDISPTKEGNDSSEGHKNVLGVLTRKPGAYKNKMVLDVPPLPTSENTAARAESDVEKGFKRFLSVLNKGVDVDLLSKIVKEDKEDLTNVCVKATCVKTKSNRALGSVRPRSDGGSSSPGCKRIIKAESITDPPCRETTISDAKEAKKTKKGCSLDSSSQSESHQTVKKKEEEESPKLDEKQKQLQSILETLGLDLEVEELSRVAERTEERLYGKKTENNQNVDSRTEQDRQQLSPHRDDQERRRSPEQGGYQHQRQNKAQRHSHRAEEDLFLKVPHSAGHTLSQYADPYDPHSSVTNPYCSYEERRSNLNNLFYIRPEQMSSRRPDCNTSVLMGERLHSGRFPRDTVLPLNPDLSFSEGQSGLALASRCLTTFQTEEFHPLMVVGSEDSLTRQKTMGRVSSSEMSALRYLKVISTEKSGSRSERKDKRKGELLDQTANQSKPGSKTDSCLQSPEASQPVEKKLTEEDIKARLREKLQAFNQKSKEGKHLENNIQPVDLLSYELS
uniref:Uncharacterized protein n=1 Tax=Iconisemion striatum TaxID=60296 RepID=A0A1A7XP80_9TELE